ncbi:MAG: toast rack family protein [Anaerolineales bacterium]|nr:toast rack family protein [Anaerolineales bacterium]
MKPTIGLFIGISALLGAALACSLPIQQTGPVQTQSEVVELGAANSANVEITMGAGELHVHGGASNLMEAEFTYNIEDWQPEVVYSVSGEIGQLSIKQPETDIAGIPDGDIRYEWDLRFIDGVPLDLEIDLGAGESTIDLGSLSVGNLQMRTGAGRVSALLGGSQLTGADINAGVGETTIDLSGDWQNNAEISIGAGVGDLTVIVPSGVGAIVNVDVGIGDISADGFRVQGGSYTNEAYGDSAVTISVDIEGGIGQITLQVGG